MENVRFNSALSCTLAALFLLVALFHLAAPIVDAKEVEVGKNIEMLASPSSITGSDVLIDISPNATKYIEGAVSIPYSEFVEEGGVMKPVSEIVGLLGGKGISQDDSVVIYGECLPCGGGPSTSTYVYWIFKYLGHENVTVLNGTVEDWAKASKPTASTPQERPREIYIPRINANLLSTYDFVKNGEAQIVDARTAKEYSAGSVTGAINIPYDQVLINDTIKDEAALMELFSKLSRDKPVVVYSNTGVRASLVWFALTLMGYDARLYSWKDWLESQPTLNLGLKEIRAEPNPAASGTLVRIVAVFGEGELNVTAEEPATNETTSNETILTTKGCVTCEPITIYTGGSLSGTKEGGAKLGSIGKAAAEAFRSEAIIEDSKGEEVARVSMQQVSGDEYAGTWKADVAPGVYKVTIVASASGTSKTFRNALEIEIAGSSATNGVQQA